MSQIKQTIEEIKNYEKGKILRPDYGQTSLSEWEKEFDSLISKLDFIDKYSDSVDSSTNNQVQNSLNNIKAYISQLVNYDEAQFVAYKKNQVKNINEQFNNIKKYWPHYATAAIEESGLLTNINVKEEFKSLTDNLKEETQNALEKIQKESGEIINQAKEKAKEIESSVRKTAEKISVQEAQEQFQNAATHNILQIKVWGGITGFLIVIFICLICYLLKIKLPKIWTWQMIYYTVIRLGLLTLVSSLIGFGLKILISHLHMHQHNLHRMRLANSTAAFSESATSKEQRDRILTQLVDSVANFGNSGMIKDSDDGSSKLTIDNITSTISKMKK
jgi:rubrerythrin